MSAIQELSNINLGVLLASICIVLVAIKYLVELFEWFITKLGLETKTMKKRREEHNLLLDTARGLSNLKQECENAIKNFENKRVHDREQSFGIQKKLTDAIDNINNKLDIMRKENLEKDIDGMRWIIINTADKITGGKNIGKEAYRYALKTYDKYERIIEENNLTNSEVDVSIEIIRKSYLEKEQKAM